MAKESMGEFLESAVASVLRFKYKWQTVIENYHLLRPEDMKKKRLYPTFSNSKRPANSVA